MLNCVFCKLGRKPKLPYHNHSPALESFPTSEGAARTNQPKGNTEGVDMLILRVWGLSILNILSYFQININVTILNFAEEDAVQKLMSLI